jgi:hypothetical protein
MAGRLGCFTNRGIGRARDLSESQIRSLGADLLVTAQTQRTGTGFGFWRRPFVIRRLVLVGALIGTNSAVV